MVSIQCISFGVFVLGSLFSLSILFEYHSVLYSRLRVLGHNYAQTMARLQGPGPPPPQTSYINDSS